MVVKLFYSTLTEVPESLLKTTHIVAFSVQNWRYPSQTFLPKSHHVCHTLDKL
jgi:hypothetical protein